MKSNKLKSNSSSCANFFLRVWEKKEKRKKNTQKLEKSNVYRGHSVQSVDATFRGEKKKEKRTSHCIYCPSDKMCVCQANRNLK